MNKQKLIAASISDAELDILRQLWESSPLSAQEIIECLRQEAPESTHPKTVKTLINRLLNKGGLTYTEKNRKYLYSPAISRDVFYATKTTGFLDKFFNGEVAPLVSCFSSHKKLNEKDLAELKLLIEKLEADDE